MDKQNRLIAIVNTANINGLMKTRFLYSNKKVLYDVTNEVCDAILSYNKDAQKIIKKNKYALIIPIRYNNGYAEYSVGFGPTHYFKESEFFRVAKYIKSFPLNKCKLEIILSDQLKTVFKGFSKKETLERKIHAVLEELG